MAVTCSVCKVCCNRQLLLDLKEFGLVSRSESEKGLVVMCEGIKLNGLVPDQSSPMSSYVVGYQQDLHVVNMEKLSLRQYFADAPLSLIQLRFSERVSNLEEVEKAFVTSYACLSGEHPLTGVKARISLVSKQSRDNGY